MIQEAGDTTSTSATPQPQIIGYRNLSPEELQLINGIKKAAEGVKLLVDTLAGLGDKIDQRWVSIARTDLQKGFMAAVRAVAKPESF